MGKPLKKIVKPPKDGDWERPVEIVITAVFPKNPEGGKNRRVVPADLHKAAASGGTAVRTVLESLDIPYEIEDVKVTTRYSYVQSENVQHV